jgi:single-strand selective monofunctional uracil DNA glycosylase
LDSKKTFAGLQKISAVLAEDCGKLSFGPPVAAVYNPLEYAKAPHKKYLELAGAAQKKVIFLGMNPGPWGMAQTGVPFGEIALVRDWLGIEAAVSKPIREHPKRPIEGFSCARSEISGRRFWGLFRERFGTPGNFFSDHFVANYCPLVFMDSAGANITLDKLPTEEVTPLFEVCDHALADTIALLKPEWVIGIGGFAKKRIDRVSGKFSCGIQEQKYSAAQILHPSPANPRANTGWDKEVIKTLTQLGVW